MTVRSATYSMDGGHGSWRTGVPVQLVSFRAHVRTHMHDAASRLLGSGDLVGRLSCMACEPPRQPGSTRRLELSQTRTWSSCREHDFPMDAVGYGTVTLLGEVLCICA